MQTIPAPPEPKPELEHKKPVLEPQIIFPVPHFEDLEKFRPLPVCLN